jgi:glycosyltransferase involved in cell wall biosynthesis
VNSKFREARVHFITGEYPPAIGGVSDYTFTMAAGLSAAGPVHVWCPPAGDAPPQSANVTVHPLLNDFSPAMLRTLGSELDCHRAPRQLFVQWTPQSFGYRSLNVGFARWLALRASRGDLLHLMVHEPFLSWSPRPARLAAAATHRLMLWLAARRATRVWVSTTSWLPLVRPYVPARTPVDWLPVPAPQLPAHESSIANRICTRPLVGHFGTHSPLVTPILARALDRVLGLSQADILLCGRDSERFRDAFVANRPAVASRIRATGALPPADIAPTLRMCDLMLQPYPDGVTTRRTSTLMLLSLGLPVVTNLGHLSENFWPSTGAVGLCPEPDGTAIGELAVALLDDHRQRLSLAHNGSRLYDARFAIRHAVALLLDATAAKVDHAA